jgi:hypothetical protein
MIQILYDAKHSVRARALAAIEAGASHNLIDMVATTKPKLDTLVLWGHGDNYGLCGKNATQMAKIISAWKKLNPQLNTVELITCNARHFVGRTDSYVNQLKRSLRSGFRSSTRNIKVKALPVTVSGSQNAWSILLAEPNTKSWCYVTAPGIKDELMWVAAKLIKYNIDGSDFHGDIALRADKVVRENPTRKWTMNYGSYKTLRRNLAAV